MTVKVVLMTATFCSACPTAKEMFAQAQINSSFENVLWEKVDAESDEGQKLVKELGIRGVPCTIFYKDDEVLFTKAGAYKTEQIIAKIEELVK